jgi:hypothetical protein
MKPICGLVGGAALFAVLCGCATEPPPPVVDLTARQCATKPDLAQAQPLVFTPDKQQDVTVIYDNATACLEEQPGAKSLYRVFTLPSATQPYLITIASGIWGDTLFAPRVVFLAADGSVKRIVARTDFAFRGTMLSAILRNHADEAYLVVSSDPEVVGRAMSRIDDTTGAAPIVTGTGYFTLHTGAETTSTQVFSHGGKVTVSLAMLPAK